MSIKFDSRGNLMPYAVSVLSIDNFRTVFVDSFGQESSRIALFNEYIRYCQELKNLLSAPFYQWIDGSFVTHKMYPNDLDFITFINHEVYEVHEQAIDAQFSKWSVGNFYTGLDAYTIWAYPENHRNQLTFQADCAYWQDWFGRSRYNRMRQRFPKGFIQINFD